GVGRACGKRCAFAGTKLARRTRTPGRAAPAIPSDRRSAPGGTAKEADEIGGYRVPPGTIVTVSPYLTHRAPDVWPDPERFDPDRFTAEQSEQRQRFASFPFAGGPRQCIGSDFAMTEATLALAMIARRYRLELVGRRKVVPQPLITLRPRGGLP